jgi:hypothetical protein
MSHKQCILIPCMSFFPHGIASLSQYSQIYLSSLGMSDITKTPPVWLHTVDRRILQIWLTVKGSVQRKLRWVENGVNRCVWAWDCGAGRFFVVLLRRHLALTVFPFPVSTAQLRGEFGKNRQSATSNVALRLLMRYMSCYWRYDALCA